MTNPADDELDLYRDAVLLLLHRRHFEDFETAVVLALKKSRGPGRLGFYATFRSEWKRLLEIPGITWRVRLEASHLFACLFQIQRAFHHIFGSIIGGSMVS